MAIVANLPTTPIPASDSIGGVSGQIYHVTIAPGGGAGTYTFNHGLPYKPTWCAVIPQNTEGTTPTLLASHCAADDSATVLAINVSANGTYEVIYG